MRSRNTKHLPPAVSALIATLLIVAVGLSVGCVQVEAADTANRSDLPVMSWQGADSFQKPSDDELRKQLTPIQYKVTQHEGTERPFANDYWDNKKDGIYVDIVSGEPLFSSTDKFKSGTGWPSFTQPMKGVEIVEKTDYKIGYARTEVRSKYADSHLGHVFPDGPKPTGLRYCINSAALQFIPKGEMEAAGYGQFLELFED